MELCDGQESIQAAHTRMVMGRAVCGLSKEPHPATHHLKHHLGMCVQWKVQARLKPCSFCLYFSPNNHWHRFTYRFTFSMSQKEHYKSYYVGQEKQWNATSSAFVIFYYQDSFAPSLSLAPLSIVKCSLSPPNAPLPPPNLQTTPFHLHSQSASTWQKMVLQLFLARRRCTTRRTEQEGNRQDYLSFYGQPTIWMYIKGQAFEKVC